MEYKYFICDVFTRTKFSGNQLAVFPEAQDLSNRQMQQIAREFNFSESTFVLPSQSGHTNEVRIYTPDREVPFAGHPNIGTAFALSKDGQFGDLNEPIEVSFEEKAGIVPVKISRDDSGDIYCELSPPEALSIGRTVPISLIAGILSLEVSEISTSVHPPIVASVGLPFLFVEVSTASSLVKASINIAELHTLTKNHLPTYIHAYCRNTNGFDLKARMFAPLDGVPEDPATGSANCALIGLLSSYAQKDNSTKKWLISQGTEVGRPSILHGRTEKYANHESSIYIGGHSVLVSEGTLTV